MKTALFSTAAPRCLLALLWATGCSTSPAVPDPPPALDGFAMPESVAHDPTADVYLVSNIDGSPFEEDGRGFISRLSPDGRVLARRWIDGLNAPKGLAVSGDVLAVADLTVLRRFDRDTGRARDVVTVPGATFLNDVAGGPDGTFYVSDSGMGPAKGGLTPTGTDALFAVGADGGVRSLARGAALSLPNGLALAGGELVMATFGSKALVRFALDGTRLGAADLPAGQLDGVVAVAGGCLFVSSLEARTIFAGPPAGPFDAAVTDIVAADIGFDARRERLLIPLIAEDRVRFLPLAAVAGRCGR